MNPAKGDQMKKRLGILVCGVLVSCLTGCKEEKLAGHYTLEELASNFNSSIVEMKTDKNGDVRAYYKVNGASAGVVAIASSGKGEVARVVVGDRDFARNFFDRYEELNFSPAKSDER
jgi:hypothetical protein